MAQKGQPAPTPQGRIARRRAFRPGGDGGEIIKPVGPRRQARSTIYRYAVVITLVFHRRLLIAFAEDVLHARQFRTIVSSQAVLMILALGLDSAADDRRIRPLDRVDAWVRRGTHAVFTGQFIGLWLVLVTTILIGVIAGAVNGLFVVRIGVNAFIGTLGTSTMLTGVTLAVSDGQILNTVAQPLVDFVQRQVFGLAVPVYVAFVRDRALAAI